jgi:outer membrane immunogenic protein
MKSLLLGTVALGAWAAAGAAAAADMSVKAPVYKAAPAPVWSWTGFYIGGAVGARWANNEWRTSDLFPIFVIPPVQPTTTGPMDSTAARVGSYFGYNWQLPSAWIVGVEADIGWANNTRTQTPVPGTAGIFGSGCAGTGTTTPCTGLPTAAVNETWDGSARGRLGMLVTPDTLLFGTAGVAWQRAEIAATCPGFVGIAPFCLVPRTESAAKTMTGWTVGGGLEQRMWSNWLARIDYRYAEFGTFSQLFFNTFGPGFDERFTGNVKVRTHTLNFGLAYKF